MRKSATSHSGEDIYLFTLTNSKGTEVCITNYGAIITSFTIAGNDIVLGFDTIEEYMNDDYLEYYPYFGAAIGRYGNRIKGGQFRIDEKQYSLFNNMGADHLHGGKIGFDKKVWKVHGFSERSLTLFYLSPDGEEGYPGNLSVTIHFELSDNDELTYTYTATTDQPTAVNLTHHSYFNLDNGTGTIADHVLKINASSYLEQDSNYTVTGKLIDVKGTAHDFLGFRKIGTKGYDQSFVIDQSPCAEVYSPKTNLMLQVYTSEPIVHLYAGSGIPNLKGKKGQSYGPSSGFCLETQIHPNAINIPSFPNTVLRPGETYHHQTIYKITQAPAK